jgi:hypothetical protein
MTNSDFLATYGTWHLEGFLACHAAQDATLVVVVVRHPRTGEDAQREIGEAVTHVWHEMRGRFAGVHGHRLSWGDLAFILPEPRPHLLAIDVTAAATAPLGSPCDLVVGGTVFPLQREERLRVLDDFSWKLAKIDHRREYSGAWCARNGKLVHVAG